MPRYVKNLFYGTNNLFLLLNGPFCPVSHNHFLTSYARARLFTVGLFSLHKSSVGQSHTGTAVTSRGTDIKVYCVSVKFCATDETLSGRSLCRYSQRPHAVDYRIASEGVSFLFFVGFLIQKHLL